jgi:hypothetical protein
MEIDPNIVSRVRGGDELMQAKETSDLFTEVHLHQESYVSVEVPTKGRAITKSHLNHPIHHKGKLVFTKKLHKGGVIQMFLGAPHGEGTQRVTPNRLEASFKSNRRESINQIHHKCFLRGGSEEFSQRG